jgi:hypothetical protein
MKGSISLVNLMVFGGIFLLHHFLSFGILSGAEQTIYDVLSDLQKYLSHEVVYGKKQSKICKICNINGLY